MASPTPLFLPPGVEQRNETTGLLPIEPDLTQPKPLPSNRGRKPSKARPPCKKQRRRGLGVAQLEKIINNRSSTEISQQQPPIANTFNHVQVGVPMTGYFFDQNGSGFNRHPPSLGPFWSNPYVFGAPNNASVFETSTELSSIPNLLQLHDALPCDSCCKKTVMNGDGSDNQGLKLNNKFESKDHEMGGFGLTFGGAEVVTVHRKMDAKGRSFFMEYEFFPDKNKDTDFKEMEMEKVGLGLGFQHPKAPSNSLDLSLKLSF